MSDEVITFAYEWSAEKKRLLERRQYLRTASLRRRNEAARLIAEAVELEQESDDIDAHLRQYA